MPRYKVGFLEEHMQYMFVEANNKDKAIEKAEEKYREGDFSSASLEFSRRVEGFTPHVRELTHNG